MVNVCRKWTSEHEELLSDTEITNLFRRKSYIEKFENKILEIKKTWRENYRKIPEKHPHYRWVASLRRGRNGKGEYFWDEDNFPKIIAKHGMADLFDLRKRHQITLDDIKKLIKKHYNETGKYPSASSGIVKLSPEEEKKFGKLNWGQVNSYLYRGNRGVPAINGLSYFLNKEFNVKKFEKFSDTQILDAYKNFCVENNRCPQTKDLLYIQGSLRTFEHIKDIYRKKNIHFLSFVRKNISLDFLIKYDFKFERKQKISYKEFKKLVREHNPKFTSGKDYQNRYKENPLFLREPYVSYQIEWEKYGGWEDLLGISENKIRILGKMKFSKEMSIQIIKEYRTGKFTQKQLAEKYNIKEHNIYQILKKGLDYYKNLE